jgi:hypothetical protein
MNKTAPFSSYLPHKFSDMAQQPRIREIWEYLNESDNIIRLCTASELSRPALEAMASRILNKFGSFVKQNRVKQVIGHMTRQIMENQGFTLDAPSIRVRIGGLFSYAARYKHLKGVRL